MFINEDIEAGLVDATYHIEEFITEYYVPSQIGNNIGTDIVLMTQDWTASLDLGVLYTMAGVAGRGSVSIAIDHEGGIALVASGGGGGITPFNGIIPNLQALGLGDLTLTVTNADSVLELEGQSVQFGASAAPEGVGPFGEIQVFSDGTEVHGGLSVGQVVNPVPLSAEIHTTVQHSEVFGGNPYHAVFDIARYVYFGEE